MLMQARAKKCRSCGNKFVPTYNTTQKVCSIECALADGIKSISKQGRKDLKILKEKYKTRAEHLREAQAVFNRYIRVRDKGKPCISCGRHHEGQNHAGHYKTVGSAPELRFHQFNCNLQCAPCNNHLSGNIVNYRHNLIKKIGLKNVEWLEQEQRSNHKLTIDEIKEIKQFYKEQIKFLNNKKIDWGM